MTDSIDGAQSAASDPADSTEPHSRLFLRLGIYAVATMSDVVEVIGGLGAGLIATHWFPSGTYDLLKALAFTIAVVSFLPAIQRINGVLFQPVLDRLQIALDDVDQAPRAEFTE